MAWFHDAACATVGVDVWFPENMLSNEARYAKQICEGCPVKADCLQLALDQRIDYGIWGGLVPMERRSLLRKARRNRKV